MKKPSLFSALVIPVLAIGVVLVYPHSLCACLKPIDSATALISSSHIDTMPIEDIRSNLYKKFPVGTEFEVIKAEAAGGYGESSSKLCTVSNVLIACTYPLRKSFISTTDLKILFNISNNKLVAISAEKT